MQLGASGGLGAGQVRFEAAPFGVGEVALVCCSHARHPTERVPQNPFSDSFLTGLWPFTLRSKPRPLVALRTPAGLLPSRPPVPTHKNSSLAPTTPCAPGPEHRRKSDAACHTRPSVGRPLGLCFCSCTDEPTA